ncbi:MAG: T9SS type A sorting domain-containing protein [Bacteroidetes bacterium]|nr:T9SS type A sorting domain-containing protein [Bacteroidota bacterium]
MKNFKNRIISKFHHLNYLVYLIHKFRCAHWIFTALLIPNFVFCQPTSCDILSISTSNISQCDRNNNDDYRDDFFTAKVQVTFTQNWGTSLLTLSGNDLVEPVTSIIIPEGDEFYEFPLVKFKTDKSDVYNPNISITATLNVNSTPLSSSYSCSFTNPICNPNHGKPKQCSVCECVQNSCGSTYNEDCHGPLTSTSPCETTYNYGPKKDLLSHTPIRYIKVVLHVFQKTGSNPENWDLSNAYILNSWFNDPNHSVNHFLSNLCDDPTDGSDHIQDARIRFVCNAVEGEDLFFYQNDNAWNGNFNTANTLATSNLTINAYHIFLFNGCLGGYTYDAVPCPKNPRPIAVMTGSFNYTFGLNNCGGPPTYPAEHGTSILGEFLHILNVDHISPLQAHINHPQFADSCEDTPEDSPYNKMHCLVTSDPNYRCALTQCQLGRAHYAMSNFQTGNPPTILDNPPFEVFPIGNGQFSYSERNCYQTDPDIIIEANQDIVWNSHRQLRSNVIVKPQGKLTITCRIGMASGTTMTIQPGGKLTVDGGEVYNNCPDGWKGFVVEGNAGLPWSLASQGYLHLTNGALIKGATMSMEVKGGGRVLSQNESTISNCGGAFFYPYSFAFENKCWFFDTNFEMDGSTYFPNQTSFYHILTLGNRGMRFVNCDFEMENVPVAMSGQTYGIAATGAVFSVTGSSTFTGFHNGISANNFINSFASNTVVDNCSFTNNYIGINAWGLQNQIFTRNTFDVGGNSYPSTIPSKGIVMTNCSGYKVEQNHFTGANDIPGKRIGILTDQSGTAANFINENHFDYLQKGNQAQGDNTGDQTGLQYWCNENLGNNTRDFYVASSGAGIFPSQGNGKAVLNEFSHNTVLTDGDFRNEIGAIDYYHLNVAAQIPNNPIGVNNHQVLKSNTCPSDSDDEGEALDFLSPTEWQDIDTKYNDAKSAWQTDATSLAALLDGGNTTSLLTTVSNVTSLNAQSVVQQLQSISPYVTSQVLRAAVSKISVLSASSVQNILTANPDELGDVALRDAIIAAYQATTATAILSQSGTSTARTTLENKVGENRTAMQRYADILTRDILKDTTTVDTTLLRTWLANKLNLEADYSIVGTYVAEADFTTAYQKLSAIPQNYTLTTVQTQAHSSYVSLVGIWENIYNNSTPIMELSPTTVASIQSIADNEPGLAGAMSRGFLNALYGYNYDVLALDPSEAQQLVYMPDGAANTSSAIAERFVTAFPNPARKNVMFNWQLPKDTEEATILLTDLQGRTVAKLAVAGQYGSQGWSTEGVDAGVYFYKVKFIGGESSIAKLVIIK